MDTNDNTVKHRFPFKRGTKVIKKHYPIKPKVKYKEINHGKNSK